jgi:transposase-like protein
MARSGIQFQKGLSLLEFQRLYGTEEQCEAALEMARWPDGFRCPRCNSHEHGLVYGRRLKRYQCRNCGHQATLTAGTIMQATKLPLTTWFLAFYLIGQAKTGISSLELSRHLGVKYDTAWLLHNNAKPKVAQFLMTLDTRWRARPSTFASRCDQANVVCFPNRQKADCARSDGDGEGPLPGQRGA